MVPQIITAAAVGALSPPATLAAIMLLGSRHPVGNTVAYLVGWTIVLLALAGLLLALFGGHDATSGHGAKAAVGLVVGLMLLIVALRSLIGEQHPVTRVAEGKESHAPAMPGWMKRLETVRPIQALGFGVVLIALSPADLAAFFSAVQALIGSDLDNGGKWIVLLVLIVCIDSCILIPLGIYLALPRRAERLLQAAKTWIVSHQRAVTGWSAGVFGVVLIANSVISLT